MFRRHRVTADPRRIHQLEFELGLRDDAPPNPFARISGEHEVTQGMIGNAPAQWISQGTQSVTAYSAALKAMHYDAKHA